MDSMNISMLWDELTTCQTLGEMLYKHPLNERQVGAIGQAIEAILCIAIERVEDADNFGGDK